jgi:hypothetical protein
MSDTGTIDARDHPTERTKARRVWVQNVDVSVSLLEARLDALAARRRAAEALLERSAEPDPADDAERQQLATEWSIDEHVRCLLDKARKAAHRRDPVPYRFPNWWGGRLVEAAYQNLHAAEALMAHLYGPDELLAEIPEAVSRVEAGLNRDDPRTRAALRLTEYTSRSDLGSARARLSKAIEVGHNAGDRDHTRLRGFRNAVLAAALVVTVLLVAFGGYMLFNHERIPLCFTPANAEGEPPSWVCPTGEYAIGAGSPTSPHDFFVVALLGLLGGAFSAALAIRSLSGTTTPYDIPLMLAILKLPLGVLTALGFLIALRGEFVPGLSELDSQGQILAYALVFGYSQQLLSGLLDRHAQGLLASAPGKDKPVQRLAPQPVVAAT